MKRLGVELPAVDALDLPCNVAGRQIELGDYFRVEISPRRRYRRQLERPLAVQRDFNDALLREGNRCLAAGAETEIARCVLARRAKGRKKHEEDRKEYRRIAGSSRLLPCGIVFTRQFICCRGGAEREPGIVRTAPCLREHSGRFRNCPLYHLCSGRMPKGGLVNLILVINDIPILLMYWDWEPSHPGRCIYLSQPKGQIMESALLQEDFLKTVPIDGPAHKPLSVAETGAPLRSRRSRAQGPVPLRALFCP